MKLEQQAGNQSWSCEYRKTLTPTPSHPENFNNFNMDRFYAHRPHHLSTNRESENIVVKKNVGFSNCKCMYMYLSITGSMHFDSILLSPD